MRACAPALRICSPTERLVCGATSTPSCSHQPMSVTANPARRAMSACSAAAARGMSGPPTPKASACSRMAAASIVRCATGLRGDNRDANTDAQRAV